MLRLLLLTTIVTFQAVCSETTRSNSTLVHDHHKQEEIPSLPQQKLTPQELLVLMHEEYKKSIEELRNELNAQKEKIHDLTNQLAEKATPRRYKKIIPADKILAVSVFMAFLNGYQTYMYTGSLILSFGNFCSNLYSIYFFLKLARDTATIASHAPLINKIG